MSAGAVVMMVIAMLVIWGGLALALWNFNTRSENDET